MDTKTKEALEGIVKLKDIIIPPDLENSTDHYQGQSQAIFVSVLKCEDALKSINDKRTILDLNSPYLKQAILDLPYSSSISDNSYMVFIPESDYGFAEIYRMYDDILVFLIPTNGGTPYLYSHVGRHAVDYLITKLQNLT